jgi:hypothetical protein
MNDIRRTILWVIFGFAMVMLWDKWQIHNGSKPTFFPPARPVANHRLQRRNRRRSAAPGAAACLGCVRQRQWLRPLGYRCGRCARPPHGGPGVATPRAHHW